MSFISGRKQVHGIIRNDHVVPFSGRSGARGGNKVAALQDAKSPETGLESAAEPAMVSGMIWQKIRSLFVETERVEDLLQAHWTEVLLADVALYSRLPEDLK